MPKVKSIIKTMREKKIPADAMNQFAFSELGKEGYPNDAITLIEQMDKFLTKEQCLSIMEEQGCCKTERITSPFIAFGQKYADKSLDEKIRLLTELNTPHVVPCRLNADGTLTIYWGFEEGGNYKCLCSAIKKLTQPINVTPTFCGCCAGHVRHTYQLALGVTLRLKEIVSSPISSDGEKQCEFLFEIVN